MVALLRTVPVAPASTTRVSTHDSDPATQDMVTRDILLDFIMRIGASDRFQFSGSLDSTVVRMFRQTTASWDLDISDRVSKRYAMVGLLIGTMAYKHAPPEVQVAIAIYTYLGAMCDDDIMPTDILREFAPRLFDGCSQLHPILNYFVRHLVTMRELYSAYSANTITVNTVEFINAEMFVRDEGGADAREPEAQAYIDFMRWKNGVGEAFVVMIWPRAMFPETKTYIQALPYAVEFICLCNDLLSFHKESKAGETDNYVSLYATIHSKPVLDILPDLVERMIEQDRCIKVVLGDGPERQAWESFVAGYIEFHIISARYRLAEILPEYFKEFKEFRDISTQPSIEAGL